MYYSKVITIKSKRTKRRISGVSLAAAAKWRSGPVLTKASKAKRPSQPLTKH